MAGGLIYKLLDILPRSYWLFSINGTNLWNALLDGMDLVANLLKAIEVPSRVVFYPLLYSMSLQTVSLNYLHTLWVYVWAETFVTSGPFTNMV